MASMVGKPSTDEKPRINERRANGGRFGVGGIVRAAGRDLTLIGLSNRHVRWDLTLIDLSN